jgi:hypothetical protein
MESFENSIFAILYMLPVDGSRKFRKETLNLMIQTTKQP